MFYQKNYNNHGFKYEVHKENKKKIYVHKGVLENLGAYKAKIYWNMGFNTHKMGHGVPCSHKCTLLVVGALLAQKITGKIDQLVVYASKLLNGG